MTMPYRTCGRPHNAPATFIHPCQPTVASKPPSGPGWAHELKHDGYRLQIHVRDGRVRLYTMNGADWSKRYPLIVRDAARIKGSAILDAEAVWLVMLNEDDMRRKSYVERKATLRKLLRGDRGIQYVEHAEESFLRLSASWALRVSFQRN